MRLLGKINYFWRVAFAIMCFIYLVSFSLPEAYAAEYINLLPTRGSGSWLLYTNNSFTVDPIWAPSNEVFTSFNLTLQTTDGQYGYYGFRLYIYVWNGSTWVLAYSQNYTNAGGSSSYNYPPITVSIDTWTTGIKIEMDKTLGNNCNGNYSYSISKSMMISSSADDQLIKASVDAAKASADAAYNAANTAVSAAQGAQSAANTAATNAQNAYNAAHTAATQTIYNGQSAAYWAYQAAQGGTDTTPPTIQKVAGQNGATCTSTGTFYVVVQATDNRAGQLQAHAQVDGGAWTGWYNIPQNAIPVTLSSTGAHTITVEVKDAAGNLSQATMTAFRV